MNRLARTAILGGLFLFAAAADGGAQVSNTPEPGETPKAPFIAKLPKFARYHIQVERVGGGSERAAAAKNDVASVEITKLDDCREFLEKFGNGKAKEFWVRGGLILLKYPGFPEPMIMNPEDVQVDVPVPEGDFSGFEWISPANFVGTSSVQGKKCFVFEQGDRRAMINIATKLPELLKQGNVVNHFEYDPAPPDNTKWPPDYEAKWQMMLVTAKALAPREGPR